MSNMQTPINSGFGPTATAQDVLRGVDLTGKTAIVTGGYSGLGLETTRALVQAGTTVIVPVRTLEKARQTLANLPNVELAELDLLDPKSIDAFANGFSRSGRSLHILINSAGIMAAPLSRDARGFESQFATNHLGHFQLTVQLFPALQKANGARVVSVSSRGHRFSGIHFDDIQFNNRDYEKWAAYGQSKTANSLFAVALDRRGKEHGIRAFSLHPGTILTDLSRFLTDEDLKAFGVSRNDANGHVPEGLSVAENGDFKTLEQGASTAVWCATSSQLNGFGGVYCENNDIAPMMAADQQSGVLGVHPWAVDFDAAEQLWEVSETLTEVKLAP
ncbi:MAG: oxidoreductase [Syntrophales bacterium]|nr:oxidoreductase [Syntrophales bacterium]